MEFPMVIPMLAVHALMGISIRNPLFSSDRLCMTTIYSLTWPTSVFVRECGINLADAVMQRSMSHFGPCRYCYSGALLSGSGHCCPFRVWAPVDFLHGRPIIGLRGFVLCQGVSERWPFTCPAVICNRCHFIKYPCECQEIYFFQTQHVGHGRLPSQVGSCSKQLFRIKDSWFL